MSTGKPFLLLTSGPDFPFSFPPVGADRCDLVTVPELGYGSVTGVHADKLFWSDTLFVGHPFRFIYYFLKNG